MEGRGNLCVQVLPPVRTTYNIWTVSEITYILFETRLHLDYVNGEIVLPLSQVDGNMRYAPRILSMASEDPPLSRVKGSINQEKK